MQQGCTFTLQARSKVPGSIGKEVYPEPLMSIQTLDVVIVRCAQSTGNYEALHFLQISHDNMKLVPVQALQYNTRTTKVFHIVSNLPHCLLHVLTWGCSWRHSRHHCYKLNFILDPSFPHVHVTSMVLAVIALLTKNLTLE